MVPLWEGFRESSASWGACCIEDCNDKKRKAILVKGGDYEEISDLCGTFGAGCRSGHLSGTGDSGCGAYSSGWGDGSNCDTCHATTGMLGTGTGVHAVSSHSGFGCSDCHDGATSAGTVSPGTCADCHVDGTSLALADVHESDHSVTVCRSCHAAATTTTTSESTTTT